MTLTDFLLARIAEDEKAARATYIDRPTSHLDSVSDCDCEHDHLSSYFLAADPVRVLAECEAKRLIVADAADWAEGEPFGFASKALELLALPYSGHPDYREEWKP